MNYFYTNDNIVNIMDRKSQVGNNGINWEKYGISVRDINRNGAQCLVEGLTVSLLPVSDKVKFNKELGGLIKIGKDEEYFYKVLTEEEANAKKEEFKQIRETQKAELGGN